MNAQDELDEHIRKAKGSAAVEEMISEKAAYQRYQLSDGRPWLVGAAPSARFYAPQNIFNQLRALVLIDGAIDRHQ
jgi:hypothetical protein